MWSSYLVFLIKVMKPLVNSLTGQYEHRSSLEVYADTIGRVEFDFIYLAKLSMYTYGTVIIFGIFTCICFLLVLYHIFYHNKKGMDLPENYFLYYSMICCLVFYIMSTAIFLSINLFNITRITRLALIFSFIVAAYTVSYVVDCELKWPTGVKRKFFLVFVLILLLLLIYFVTFGYHHSPIIKKSHNQFPMSSFLAAQHLFENRQTSLPIIEHGLALYRFNDANYGTETSKHKFYSPHPEDIPDHFGYNENNSLGYYFERDHYYLLTDRFRGFYPSTFPEFPHMWRYTATDFILLMSDSSIDKIYSNKCSDIFYINSHVKPLGLTQFTEDF